LICRGGSGNGHRAGGYRAQFGVNVEKTHLFEASSGALITRKG
jgi:hypothetical protein